MPIEPIYTFGLALAVMRRGSRPALEFIITAPDVRSPCSTEGMPRITSIDSILSVETVRMSIPVVAETPPPVAVVLPAMVGFMVDRLALLDSGAPSRIIAVPSEFIEPEPRMLAVLAALRFGSVDNCPGNSDMTSLRLVACMWSMAVRPMIDDVDCPAFDVVKNEIISGL